MDSHVKIMLSSMHRLIIQQLPSYLNMQNFCCNFPDLLPVSICQNCPDRRCLVVMQRVSNSRVRDRLGFSQSGSGLGSVCTLASGSAGFGFFVGFLYLDLSKISSRVWFGFMLKIRVRVSVCKK